MPSPFTPVGYIASGVFLGVCLLAVLFDVGAVTTGGLHRIALVALIPVVGISLSVLVIGVPYEIVKRARRR